MLSGAAAWSAHSRALLHHHPDSFIHIFATSSYQNMFVWSSYLHVIYSFINLPIGSSSSSPEVVYVCLGKQLMLTCATNVSIIEWNVTAQGGYGVRLILSTGAADIQPLIVNNTTFTFSRESREPLNVTLSADNVTMDFRIFCLSVPPGTTHIDRAIQVIRMNHIKSIF